jgi:hypothetical protein
MKLKTIHKSLIIIFIVFIVFILMFMTRLNKYITYFLIDTYFLNSKTKYKNIPKIKNTTPIYIFIHLCNYGDNWKTIISSQITQIIKSGLYTKCEQIFYGCSCDNCEEELKIFLKNYKKLIKLPSQPNYVHENMTINHLLKFSKQQTENVHILYLHSKGVTGRSVHQNYWRDYMMNYNVNMWEVCVNLLNNNYNTVGVNYKTLVFKDIPHYSGNFWWGRSDYIKKLDYVDESKIKNRLLAELKLLDKKEKNKHINLGSEFWLSTWYSGLYSPIDYDHSSDYAEHKYCRENPDELDIYIF